MKVDPHIKINEAISIFSIFDKDKSGGISFDEFYKIFKS
jgi:Ca2+-binding EF-hand superfamily protein